MSSGRNRRKAITGLDARWGSIGLSMLDAMLPTRCVRCHRRTRSPSVRPPTPFCADCEAMLPWWRRVDGCPRCGHPDPADESRGDPRAACPRCLASGSPLHRCTSLVRYEGPVTRWIPGFKHGGRALGPPLEPMRVIDFLAQSLATRIAPRARLLDLDLLVAVPSHPRRLLRRGFDPALWIAERLARETRLPLETDSLARVGSSTPQASLRGEARRENVRDAFELRSPIPRDARIGLVDDVLTTGATLEATSSLLLEAGAWEVHAFTLAATLPQMASAAGRAHSARRLPEMEPPC
jgi:ComF family protein